VAARPSEPAHPGRPHAPQAAAWEAPHPTRAARGLHAAALLTTALFASCDHKVPDHLQRLVAAPPPAPRDWSTTRAALRTILASDPLARRPDLPSNPDTLAAVGLTDLGDVIYEVLRLPADRATLTASLDRLELAHPEHGAWIRGRGLLAADARLVFGADATGWPLDLTSLLSPLTLAREDARSPVPLAWLASGDGATAARRHGDRWALTGWLLNPATDLDAVAHALDAPQYDALRASPHGALIMARAGDSHADAAPGLARLAEVTGWALAESAADTDAEQKAWRARAATLAGGAEPIRAGLEAAVTALSPAASADPAGGGAWLALEAMRWRNVCADPPCGGVDRAHNIARAGAWSPDLSGIALSWRVITLKTAVDGYDVGRDTVRHRPALIDLVDALIGLGCPPPPADLVLRPPEDPALWHQLGRMLGTEEVTDWDRLRPLLMARLAAEAASGAANTTGETSQTLNRIAVRASP
jgi:hypothetical protein